MIDEHIWYEIAQYYQDHNLWPMVIDEYYEMYGYPHGRGHYSDHNPYRINTSLMLLEQKRQEAEEELLRYPERKYHTHISLCERAKV